MQSLGNLVTILTHLHSQSKKQVIASPSHFPINTITPACPTEIVVTRVESPQKSLPSPHLLLNILLPLGIPELPSIGAPLNAHQGITLPPQAVNILVDKSAIITDLTIKSFVIGFYCIHVFSKKLAGWRLGLLGADVEVVFLRVK